MVDPVFAIKATALQLAASTATAIPNPIRPIIEAAGEAGKKTLWVVFVVQFLSSISFFFLAYRTPVQKRLFHVITAFITTFATLSYYALATGEGVSFVSFVVKVSHKDGIDIIEHGFRQVFWARYVDWALTTPLLLLDLAFLAGLNGANIVVAIVADLIMVLTGLFAAFSASEDQKWGWYTFSSVAFLVIVYQLVIPGRRAVVSQNSSIGTLYASIGAFTLILWTLYPIVWAVSEGTRKVSVDTEIIAYAILDVLAKPGFGFWLLFAHAKSAAAIDGFWSRGLTHEGGVRLDDDEA